MAAFIEFPVFDGVSGDLWQWIMWLEDFFIREKFTKLERLNLAQSLLEGQAEAWFYRNQKMLSSWTALRDRLWLEFGDSDEIDRFFQERVEQKKKRMETTSINLQESISNQQKLVEGSSENVAENWDEKASEKKLIFQCQVPNSSLEPSFSFSSESLDVSASWPCAIVSNNPVDPQVGFESVKNTTNAHQVLDKTSAHKDRLKSKSKRMLSMSPKTWMFKFKNKNLQRQYSCSRATFGSKGNDHNSRYWRRMRQTHMSRLLCVYQPNADKALEALKEIQSQQATVRRDGTKVSSLLAKELVVPGDIVELRVGESNIKILSAQVIAQQPVHKETSITHLQDVVGCDELGKVEKMFSGFSHTCQVWKPGIGVCSGIKQPIDSRRASRVWERGGLAISTALPDWLMKCYKGSEFSRLMRKLLKIDLQWVMRKDLEEWCGWMVFDRGKRGPKLEGNCEMRGLLGITMSCFRNNGSVLVMVLYFNLDGKKWSTKSELPIRDLKNCTLLFKFVQAQPLSLSQDQKAIAMAWIRNQWMTNQNYVNSREDSIREFLIQWQGRDVVENFWVYCMAFVQSYHAFKLEDKLVFEGGSIDTTQRSYYRKKKKDLAVEARDLASSLNSREASSGNSGFAKWSKRKQSLQSEEKVCGLIVIAREVL